MIVTLRKKVRHLSFVAFVAILTAMVVAPANAAMGAGPETYTVTVGGDLPNRGGNGESMYMGYGPSVILITAGTAEGFGTRPSLAHLNAQDEQRVDGA